MYLCKTYFSFKYGTFSTEQLVKEAVDAGATSLALTNINSTCDAWDFVQYCQEQQIKPILGVEIRNGHRLLYILLAANNRGFRWINEFLSGHLLEKKPFPDGTSGTAFFSSEWEGGATFLSSSPKGAYSSTDEQGMQSDGNEAKTDGIEAKTDGNEAKTDGNEAKTDGNEAKTDGPSTYFSGTGPTTGRRASEFERTDTKTAGHVQEFEKTDIKTGRHVQEFERTDTKTHRPATDFSGAEFKTGKRGDSLASDGFVIYPLGSKMPEELLPNERIGVLPDEVNKLLKLSVAAHPDKWIIRQPVTFQNKTYYNLHRLLRAVDLNTLLTKLKPEDLAGEKEYFLPQMEVLAAFRQYPFMITNTYLLFDVCTISMDFGGDKNKKIYSATKEDDRVLLDKLARDGCRMRYGSSKRARERLNKELRIIDQMGFTAYFLITWDMIRYAQSRGFYHVGRGSGANSVVAYCLQITDVDPIELDLYFERFLNPHRTSPPDFDIDFSYRDRDEIIDYMMKRYGKRHAALLGMYSTFQYNAIIRELGKVFGLPKEEIDGLAERGYYNGNSRGENFMKRTDMDRIHRVILQYGKLLQNFPATLSIHPGGILISEEAISSYVAVHMPPKGFPTTMMDMFVAENIGLHKLDVLSQRGLGHIKECIELVKANRQVDINIHAIEQFKKDPLIKEQLRRGNTIGCFYIESPAMRQLIRKLRCDNYETLVAASSIIRPGVGRSGMMAQYIFRYNNPDKFEYPHPKLKEVLGSTYGVMIYQEQVIQVAHEWAGLDMADADLLRRATSAKYRGKGMLPMLKERFFSNCSALAYPTEVVEDVWRQIESFADFSFCKAHSASYAVESYQSLFLKTYYPMEFAVAVINNFGGFYSRELYFYELMRSGARVHRPCVNNGDYYTNIRGEDAYVGFVHIKGLEQGTVDRLLEARMRGGGYVSVADVVERSGVTSEQLELLIRAGALRFTGKSKKELLWEGDFVQKKSRMHGQAVQPLFKTAPLSFTLPVLPDYPLEDCYDDVELLGFPVSDPFVLVDDDPLLYGTARDLPANVGKCVTVMGYHITHKPVRTVKGETMSFGTFLDVNKEWIDTVHFPPTHAAYPPRAGFFKITGKVIVEFGVYGVEVVKMEKAGIRHRNA